MDITKLKMSFIRVSSLTSAIVVTGTVTAGILLETIGIAS